MEQNRRQFIRTTSTLLSAAAAGTGLQSCGIGGLFYSSNGLPLTTGDAVIEITSTAELQVVGGSVKKRFTQLNDGNVVIVVRTGEKEFRAFSSQCTHWGAEVELPARSGVMVCPFHGSRFSDADGSVIEGPASQPLPLFSVTYDEQRQTLTLSPNPA